MRNYIHELHENGLNYKQLSQQTGINAKRISKISRGLIKVKSNTREYQIIRNANRRNAYNKLVESGLSPEAANKYRRIGLSEQTYTHRSQRQVAHTKINATMHQLKLLAEFQNIKTKETRIIECFSLGHKHINAADIKEYLSNLDDYFDEISEVDRSEYDNEQEMIDEAIRDGQSKLGGSNWELKRIIDIETITYNIG